MNEIVEVTRINSMTDDPKPVSDIRRPGNKNGGEANLVELFCSQMLKMKIVV
jgi:hypothetical protein